MTFLRAFTYGPKVMATATAISPFIITNNNTCARFSTIFSTLLSGVLKIFVKYSNGEQTILSSITRPPSSEIVQNILPLPKNTILSVVFEANMNIFGHEIYLGNISVDKSCSNYANEISVNCTFESELLCGYIADHKAHGYSWIKSSSSGSNFNGPKKDHTFENSSK